MSIFADFYIYTSLFYILVDSKLTISSFMSTSLFLSSKLVKKYIFWARISLSSFFCLFLLLDLVFVFLHKAHNLLPFLTNLILCFLYSWMITELSIHFWLMLYLSPLLLLLYYLWPLTDAFLLLSQHLQLSIFSWLVVFFFFSVLKIFYLVIEV